MKNNIVEYKGALYSVKETKGGWLRLNPLKIETLKITAKNDIIKQFSVDDLMEELIKKANEPRIEKVIIEQLGGAENEQYKF